MKHLKHILAILFFGLFINQVQAQEIFIGTWEYQEGNEIFRVYLWDMNEPDDYGNMQIVGHYEKVEIVDFGLGNGEQFIYCSDKEKFVGNNQGLTFSAFLISGNNEFVGGGFTDNTVDEALYSQLKLGHLTMEILTNSGGTITASWKVERKSYQGVIASDEAPEFSVPTNIILTKVE